ncbi:MAG: ABC-F family ATP-binding cassette domain-containing protein [Fibrobacterota bacterium]|nr:MAG: ABC-F family ATP-binding cassette domain-containing protein [Fibrobacterota bacterium]
MIDLSNIRLSFGSRDIFQDVSLRVEDNERVALFGINGAGKSTLLKIISGQVKPDAGEIALGRGEIVGYLAQEAAEATADSGGTVFEYACSAFDELKRAHERCEEIEHRMTDGSATDEDYEEYGHLHDRLAVGGGWSFESEARTVLAGLGFQQSEQDRPLSSFSGGWRMRAALAQVLLRRPSILLLDEPTNHLDLESIMWLENHIKAMPASVLFITHDRSFVDNLAHRIVELELGRARTWPVPYTKFRADKALWLETLKNSYDRQQTDIAQTERFIQRFKATSTKSSAAMSRQKQLDKIERIELPPEVSRVALRFPTPPESGAYPYILRDVGKSYGDKVVLQGLEFSISRGEKVALVGINGAGKSTLLHLFSQKFPPTSGELGIGAKTEIGLFAQYDDLPDDELDRHIGDILYDAAPKGTLRTKVRTLLGNLLFSGDDADKPYRVLSGGEKARVRLGLLLLQPNNVLLLDEPTNHLDLATREAMVDALKAWPGTLVFVSHDRLFTRELAGRILAVGGGRVVDWPGTYEEYLAVAGDGDAPGLSHLADFDARRRQANAAPAQKKPEATKAKEPAASPKSPPASTEPQASSQNKPIDRDAQKEERRKKKRLEELEARIGKLDQDLSKLDETMAQPGFFDDYDKSAKALSERDRIVKEQEAAWAEVAALDS